MSKKRKQATLRARVSVQTTDEEGRPMTSDYARAVLAAAAERVDSLPAPLRSDDGDALLWRSQVLAAIQQPAEPAYACLVCIPGEFVCPDCEATP